MRSMLYQHCCSLSLYRVTLVDFSERNIIRRACSIPLTPAQTNNLWTMLNCYINNCCIFIHRFQDLARPFHYDNLLPMPTRKAQTPLLFVLLSPFKHLDDRLNIFSGGLGIQLVVIKRKWCIVDNQFSLNNFQGLIPKLRRFFCRRCQCAGAGAGAGWSGAGNAPVRVGGAEPNWGSPGEFLEEDDRDCLVMRFMKRRPLEGFLRTLLELEAEADGTASDFLPVIFLAFLTFHVFVVICRNRLLDERFTVMLERLKNIPCRLKNFTSPLLVLHQSRSAGRHDHQSFPRKAIRDWGESLGSGLPILGNGNSHSK